MNLYWKIICWISLVGNAFGLIIGLIYNSVTSFQIVWLTMQIVISIKALELAKDAEIKIEESK